MQIPYFEKFRMYFRQLGKEQSDYMTYCDSTI